MFLVSVNDQLLFYFTQKISSARSAMNWIFRKDSLLDTSMAYEYQLSWICQDNPGLTLPWDLLPRLSIEMNRVMLSGDESAELDPDTLFYEAE